MKKIIDTSTYNSKVDWASAKKQGVAGAILKIIRKDLKPDDQFYASQAACEKNKMPWGVYNYSYATTTGKAQSDMKLVCDMLDKLDKKYFKLGVWFDIEDGVQKKLSKATIASILNTAKEVVEKRGYDFGIYCDIDFYKEHIDRSKIKCKNWWVARYYKGTKEMKFTTDPSKDYKPAVSDIFAWQYTASGTFDPAISSGNGKHVDLSVQYRDFETKNTTQEATAVTKTEKAITWMENTAKDNSHGYDQTYRWGEKGDYDCSAAVITAWEKAGVAVKKAGASYTGDMLAAFKKSGFKDVTSSVTLSTGKGLKRGDVMLTPGHHVAMYCGDGKEVEASINEKGKATGGKPGDQTKKEFLIRSYRNYPWKNILRYTEGTSNTTTSSSTTKKSYTGVFPTLPSRGYFKTGDKGAQVKRLQAFLNWYGSYGLSVDGEIGAKTIAAVKKFQKATGLTADGLFGKKSLAKAKTMRK